MRPELLRKLAGAAAALALFACPAPPAANDGGAGGGGGGGAGGGTAQDAGIAQSAHGNVRFKRNIRLTADIAQAMRVPFAEVCKELGQYDCANTVHTLAVGGTDPYRSGIYEPQAFTGVTSPIVVDRIALTACTRRVDADLATPAQAAFFGSLSFDAQGKLQDLEGAAYAAALDGLYKAALLRPPTAQEMAHHRTLVADVAAKGKPRPGRDALVLSCFAVFTSTEFLFY